MRTLRVHRTPSVHVRSYILILLAVEAVGRIGDDRQQLLDQIATNVAARPVGEIFRRKGVVLEYLRRILSTALQVPPVEDRVYSPFVLQCSHGISVQRKMMYV